MALERGHIGYAAGGMLKHLEARIVEELSQYLSKVSCVLE